MKIFFALLIFAFSAGFVAAQETGGAKGKVRAANEKALADATVTARQDGKNIKFVKSDDRGNFELTGLAPGVYNFVFEKAGFGTGIKYNVEIEKKKIQDLGDRLILAIDQGTLVFIKGSVFDEQGKSVPGAEVKIERLFPDGKAKKTGNGYTGISGEFAFRFAEGAAKYRVTASAKGVSASKEVEVESAAIYRVALTLNINKQ